MVSSVIDIPRRRPPKSKSPPPAPAASDDDVALFRDAIGEGVVRVESDRAEVRAPRPAPLPRQSIADERRVLDELMSGDPSALEEGELLSYVRGGASKRVLRKLGRGEYSVRDEIDLHGMFEPVAAGAIAQFLEQAKRAGHLCVRIVHGKGLRSQRGPVLKHLTDKLLRQRNDVLAFRSARSADGGSGAVIVLLRGDRR